MSNATTQAIIDALTGRQAQAANSPWAIAGQVAGAGAGNMQVNMNPWERAMLAGLGGFSSGFGNAQAEKDMELLTGKFADALKSNDIVGAIESDPDLAKYASKFKLAQMADKQAIAAEEAKYQREIEKDYAKKGMRVGEDGTVIGVPGFSEVQAQQQGSKAAASAYGRLGVEAKLAPGIEAAKAAAKYPYQLQLAQAKEAIRAKGEQQGSGEPSAAEAEYLKELGFDIKPGVTWKALSLGERRLGSEGVADRFEAQREAKQSEMAIPGYEYTGATRPTSSEAKAVREDIANNSRLIATLDIMEKNIDANGFVSAFGNNAQLQNALYGFVFNVQRDATGSGAHLTGNEIKLIEAMTPQVLAGNPAGAIKTALTGRDPAQLARDLKTVIKKTQDASLEGRLGLKPIEPVETPKVEIPKRIEGESPSQYLQRIKGGQ